MEDAGGLTAAPASPLLATHQAGSASGVGGADAAGLCLSLPHRHFILSPRENGLDDFRGQTLTERESDGGRGEGSNRARVLPTRLDNAFSCERCWAAVDKKIEIQR